MQRVISKNWVRLTLIFLFSFGASLTAASIIRSAVFGRDNPQTSTTTANETTSDENKPIPDFIDLQPIIDAWIADLPLDSQIGLSITDLNHDKVAASTNQYHTFSMAPLDDILLTYSGYRSINLAKATPDDILTKSTDGSDSTFRFNDCLVQVLQTNSETCSELLRSDQNQLSILETTISALNLSQTSINDKSSTPQDFSKLLGALWQHTDLSLDTWAEIQASLLENSHNPDTRGIMAANAKTAKVYTKSSLPPSADYEVMLTYSEAGFIEFANQGQNYAIVIFAENLTPHDISRLIDTIESHVLNPTSTDSPSVSGQSTSTETNFGSTEIEDTDI